MTTPPPPPGPPPSGPPYGPPPHGPPPYGPPPQQQRSVVPWIVLGIVAVLLAATAVVAVLVTRDEQSETASGDNDTQSAPESPPESATDDATTDTEALSEEDRAAAVAAAEEAVGATTERDYREYDAQVSAALELMTPAFAERFRTITEEVRAEFVRSRTVVEQRIVGSGVSGAEGERVQVLVFSDQTVTRGSSKSTTQSYAIVLTMVRDGATWVAGQLSTGVRPDVELDEPDADRAAVLARTEEFAEAFLNLDHRTVEEDLAAVRALATGAFLEELDQTSGDLAELTTSARSVQVSEVLASAVVSIDGNNAHALVAADGSVSNRATGGDERARSYRLRVELELVGDEWLVAGVELVP